MRSLRLTALCFVALLFGLSASGANGTAHVVTQRVSTHVDVARLISPTLGYAVVYRTVEQGYTSRTRGGLFLFSRGRWTRSTPRGLAGIDDVSFADSKNGWIATFNCARAAVRIYRTSNGGQSWRDLGIVGYHSCSAGGTTFLSFVDRKHGWAEPISPTGPGGSFFRTVDGGRTWKGLGEPLCLAPIAFVSPSVGWMGRCNARVYRLSHGGRRWTRVRIRVPAPAHTHFFDIPRFFGRRGVLAAALGRTAPNPELTQVIPRSVAFMVSGNGGHSWSMRSLRPVARCPFNTWTDEMQPATAEASSRVWWIVSGRRQKQVQITTDAGRRWRTVTARGLPGRACSVLEVSAASARMAWATVALNNRSWWLFQTLDGGHTWHRATVFGRG
jgi:photosystem II stability/assembly factor-like uncharacterized protein